MHPEASKNPEKRFVLSQISVDSNSKSASHLEGCNYEVFLSFRGVDTGNIFTDFLYKFLVDSGIRTFKDDDEHRLGDEIGPIRLKAIKDSKFSILIFSKNYASSKHCLDELEQIVDCHKNGGQMILPVFYHLDPSDVRNQNGSYRQAFQWHEKKFDEKKVQVWRDAMKFIGNLKGLELTREAYGCEANFFKLIVEEVLLKLRQNHKHLNDNLVGMDHHLEEMQKLQGVNNEGVRAVLSQISVDSNSKSASASFDMAHLDGCDYEVFLSFCGIDTGNVFSNFLYTYLVDSGIRTFKDDDEHRHGDEIGPVRLKAIKDSKFSIPIISKNYASSKRCLDELEQIVDCHKIGGQMIFPVFYHVDPSDVRNQKGSYHEVFQRHEKKFDKKKVQVWKDAMRIIGSMAGYALRNDAYGGEGNLVKMIVEKVLLRLRQNYKPLNDNLVGMDHHVEEMQKLLDVNDEGVRIVGIHGVVGIGKTVIAKVIYNQLINYFDCCCFLENVQDSSHQQNGILDLQNQLVSAMLRRQIHDFSNVEEGIHIIKDIVHGRNVLLLLDDINQMSQFDKLVGECDWYGAHSRIVITTRNKEFLKEIEVKCKREGVHEAFMSYEVQLMSYDNSLQLFSRCAFMRDLPLEDYIGLSKDIVSAVGGLPLVLVTVGSTLFQRKKKMQWQEMLVKLRTSPHKAVQDRLKISFDALNYKEQQIFLDIACLFAGKDISKPYYMWEDCELNPRSGIYSLVVRSLVNVEHDNTLRMPDQFRDLGRQIVVEENLDPARRSRVWHPEEALDILKRRSDKGSIEALNLDLREFKEVDHKQFRAVLAERSHLVKSKAKEPYYIHRLVRRDFINFPSLRFLRVGFAELDGDFEHLLSNLRWLKWRCCKKFMSMNLDMVNLVIADLSYSEISDEWDGWTLFKGTKKLKVLNLSCCLGLIKGPDFSLFTSLERLNLRDTDLREINPSLGKLKALKALDLSYCNLPKLDCSSFQQLESLNLDSCKFLSEVSGLGFSECLTTLKASNCASLRTLGDLSNLKKLKRLEIIFSFLLPKVEGLENLECLELLDMRNCKSIETLPDLSNLRMLKHLFLADCDMLIMVKGFGQLEFLEELNMSWCESIESLPNLSNLRNLKRLDISNCKKLRAIEGLSNLKSLERLDLSSCKSLEQTLDISNMKNLKELGSRGLKHWTEIRGIENLTSFKHSGMQQLPD